MMDGKVLCMEVDTRASSSILAKSFFNCIWPLILASYCFYDATQTGRTLQATTTQLTTYTGQKLHVLGRREAKTVFLTFCFISQE